MAFFPDVKPGDAFKPSVALSNDVRHLVNAMNGFKSPTNKNFFPGSNRIQVYNATTATIAAGTAVSFTLDALCGEAIPCAPKSSAATVWGVLANALASREVGDCIISGVAKVKLSGGSGAFAKPDDSNPAQFVRTSSGVAQILYEAGSFAFVNIGCGSEVPVTPINYVGDFSLRYIGNNQVEVYQPVGLGATETRAGWTDLGYIDKTTLTLNSNFDFHYIYVHVSYNTETKQYTKSIKSSTSHPGIGGDGSAIILLGTVDLSDSGKINQMWRNGSIYFSQRWWI